MSSSQRSTFSFYLSSDINLQVKLRIVGLHGELTSFRQYQDLSNYRPAAVYAVAKLVANGEVLGLESKTTYTEVAPDGCTWGDWLTFCIKYRDLPQSVQLCFNVYYVAEGQDVGLVGGTTMPLFNKKGRLKTGKQILRLWGRQAASMEETPGKLPLSQRGQLGQMERLVKLYARGDVPQLEWLDSLTFREVQGLHEAEMVKLAGQPQLHLAVELPAFAHAVLYQQQASSGTAVAPLKKELQPAERSVQDSIIVLHDPEVGLDNPAELKAQKLARNLNRGVIDRDLKPNSDERKRIAAVLKLAPNKALTAQERTLLWRFRFSLVSDQRALTKFLKSVDWGDVQEAKQAAELMQQWAGIEVADALELLSPDFSNQEVRAHAVSVLQAKEDEELLYYLLQLVQALRYEPEDDSRLARFLVARAARNPVFATFLHWYLFVEWEDAGFGARASAVHSALVSALQRAGERGERVWDAIRRQTDMVSQLCYVVRDLKASKLRAARATERLREMVADTGPCGELTLMRVALPLNPHLLLEGLVPAECSCFKSAQLPLKLSFRVNPFVMRWVDAGEPGASAGGGPLAGRHGSGSESESEVGARIGFGRVPVDSSMPNIGMAPMLGGGAEDGDVGGEATAGVGGQGAAAGGSVPHRTGVVTHGNLFRCVLIYKKGDDLRQDQFVLQMIWLMDRLLKRENLDLRLTPYRVLPTSADDGLVEFVPSTPLSKVLAEHRTIQRFLALTQADPNGPMGLRADCLETFVRSCAGYCVMTYILGVGDRHLDNLMLCSDGRLFHIDFGYILGNDPKPFPPPMKLCREMIEAMGGQDSGHYVQFRMFSCEAYNILRKSADLILSLFHLMAGASIDAIRSDPLKAMLKLQEKLRLDSDDEAAVEWMQQLINESATALMPQIVETTHRWAQYWR